MLKLGTTLPISWKALLDGAKIVTSLRLSTVETRFVEVRPPARAVSWLSIAESEGERGMVRTVSRMWITPPLNIIFAVVTVDFSFRPEKISTDVLSLLDIPPCQYILL
jgi:hypothetical protein